jgi:hypothetical protein
MTEEKMGRTKGDEEGESWSRSTTEVLKETEKEEREMYMPPSPAKKNTATIKKDAIVSHHLDQGTVGLLDNERRIYTSGDVDTC